VADERSRYPVLVLSPSGFPPLLLAATAEELASHGVVVVGVNHTYETAATVLADGRVIPTNPAAVAGVLGAQTGPYRERFRRRAAVCDYKAAALASVADQLEQLTPDATPAAGRLELGRLGGFGHAFGGWRTVHHHARPGYTLQVVGGDPSELHGSAVAGVA
jgi:predicted dienelactone hydrolase